jgi:predicted RNA methylase
MDPSKDKRQFLFKKVPDQIRVKLLLDEEAMYSTTDQITAEKIAASISEYVSVTGEIIDATACVGGSTLALASVFKKVVAIEKDQVKFGFLKHNMTLLGLSEKVTCVHGDCLEKCIKYKSDAIFIDPPWGGPQYKNAELMSLTLSGIPLSEVCRHLSPYTQYIILKVPTNFDEKRAIDDTSDCMKLMCRNTNLRKMNLLIFRTTHSRHHAPQNAA